MIDVAFTRTEIRPTRFAIVIDVLRATSTVAQALAAGYERVLCADTIERARGLRGGRRVLAGERHCLKPEGFDQGNSPRDAALLRGRELVLASTNGAPSTVAAAAVADEVLLGCLMNLDAVLAWLLRETTGQTVDIQLVCSGTDGEPALEDVYVAGLIGAALPPGPRSDAARVAEAVSRAFEVPLHALSAGTNAQVLRASGLSEDIGYCAQMSRLSCVPRVVGTREGVAIVVDGAAGQPHRRAHRGTATAVSSEAAVGERDTVMS